MNGQSSTALAIAAALLSLGLSSGCRVLKPETPPQRVRIERLQVTGQYPDGSDRFEAWAMITGYKTGANAQLLPPRQWLDGYRVHLEQLERPASEDDDSGSLTPFTRSLPIDTSKLRPGFYIVNINGSEKRLEIPDPPEPEPAPGADGDVAPAVEDPAEPRTEPLAP